MNTSSNFTILATPKDTYVVDKKVGSGVQGDVYRVIASNGDCYAIKVTNMS